jgi:hypothetical protein
VFMEWHKTLVEIGTLLSWGLAGERSESLSLIK